MNLAVQLAPTHNPGLLIKNPVMTSSGTFGYGTEYSPIFDIQKLGAIVCKGTTLLPKEGNPQPRLKETASGILNSIGLQNIGVEALIEEKAPLWASWQVPVEYYYAGPGNGRKEKKRLIIYTGGRRILIDKPAYSSKVLQWAKIMSRSG